MSFILDALRRAESERARGQVPGLHDQPPLPAAAVPRSAWPIGAWALLAGLVLLLAAAALWWLRPQAAMVPVSGQTAAPAPIANSAVPAVVSAPPAAVVPPVAPPRATAPLLPQVVSAPSPVVPVPVAAAAPSSAAAPVLAPPPVAAREVASPVVKLAELPADQRREWPNLTLGGSVWSESAANRFVMVNGLLLHEGEAVAPGLVVERIGPKAVVLRWRDRRVEVPL